MPGRRTPQKGLDAGRKCRLDAKRVLNRFKEREMAGQVKSKTALLARVLTIGVWMCAIGTTLHGQTIRVDATPSHAMNTIVPTKALGAGIDRLGYGAADKLFTDATIQQMLSAGWQAGTYRQNTELHMEAWHG